jgi:hypothetical protein
MLVILVLAVPAFMAVAVAAGLVVVTVLVHREDRHMSLRLRQSAGSRRPPAVCSAWGSASPTMTKCLPPRQVGDERPSARAVRPPLPVRGARRG